MDTMKKLICFAVLLAVAVSAFAGCDSSREPKPTEGLAFTKMSRECVITGIGTASQKKIVIPSEIDGLPVTEIEKEAFKDTAVVSVFIPSSVVIVGDYAFSGCVNLRSVTFSQGVGSIGEGAFYGCTALREIVVPESVGVFFKRAFYGCTGLKYVLIEGCPNLFLGCFQNCTSLKSFRMVPGNGDYYEVGHLAFSSCTALEELVLAEGAECLGDECLAGTASLKELYIPAFVSVIGPSVFSGSGIEKVRFGGSKEEWEAIKVHQPNEELASVEIEYNCGN